MRRRIHLSSKWSASCLPFSRVFFHSGVVQAFRPARNGGPEGPHYTWVKKALVSKPAGAGIVYRRLDPRMARRSRRVMTLIAERKLADLIEPPKGSGVLEASGVIA